MSNYAALNRQARAGAFALAGLTDGFHSDEVREELTAYAAYLSQSLGVTLGDAIDALEDAYDELTEEREEDWNDF